ncbi:MAG: arsenite methyltransferase [Rhodospirillales bacterium]|nr:arsenite methyltransferase [Rhodospirillales bacterium]
MTEAAGVRARISEAYGQAVTKASSRSCCGDLAKVSVRDIGYTDEELQALPDDVLESSFGCGNPLAFSAVAEGDIVLDLGSGAGLDLLVAAKKVGRSGRVIGVDMTDEMIEKARATVAAVGLGNVEVRKGVIEELPVEDSSVDWVISNCVINLSTEKDRVFSEIWRVLKPGGRVQVSDIVMEAGAMPAWVADHAELHADLYSACIAGAVSETEYMSGMTAAGLSDVSVNERLIYDASQIRGFIDLGDVPVNLPERSREQTLSQDQAAELVATLTGNVWSGKFCAQKPITA